MTPMSIGRSPWSVEIPDVFPRGEGGSCPGGRRARMAAAIGAEDGMRIGKERAGFGCLGAFAATVGLAVTATLPAQPAPSDPTAYVSGPDIEAAVAAMRRDMKPDQGFLWRPLLRGG